MKNNMININQLLRAARKRTTNKPNVWDQGIYQVKNLDKYIGTSMPSYKSGLEKRVLNWLDNNIKVKKWGYEIVSIPYNYSLNNTNHKYITDFYAEIEDNNGNIQKYILEIKPSKSLTEPEKPKNPTGKALKNYIYSLTEYMKNKSKWSAAVTFCESNNMKFKVLTEKQIY